MRTISIPKGAKLINSGSFGSYYRINSRKGIKVIWHSRINIAEKEALYLNVAAKAGLAPRCHEVVKIKHKLGWANYGLIVDHIEGRATSWDFENEVIPKQQKDLRKALRNAGIVNHDLYGNNVRRTKRGYMVVDFTPSQCRFIK